MSRADRDTERFTEYLQERLPRELDPEKREAVKDLLHHFQDPHLSPYSLKKKA